MTEKEKSVLKQLNNVKWFKNLSYGNAAYADVVRCNHCENNMLVPVGSTYCPLCGEEVSWIEELENEGIYEVEVHEFDKINPVEILSSNCVQKALYEY